MTHPPRPLALLLALATLAAATPRTASAWGTPHELIARAAMELLPAWERELIGDQADPFASQYCFFPDMPNKPEAKPYLIAFPRELEMSFHIPRNPGLNRLIFDAYLPKVIDLLRSGNRVEALRFFGCVAHYLEDSAAPCHPAFGESKVPADGPPILALEFFKRFLPLPADVADSCLHARIDSCPMTLDQIREAIRGHRPRLLGHCVQEWIFHLAEEHWRMNQRSCRRLIPMLQAMGGQDRSREVAIGVEAAADAARLLADSLHTLLSIASDRLEGQPAREVDLSTRAPSRPATFAWTDKNHLGNVLPGRSGAFCLNQSDPADLGRQPLRLRMPDESVRTLERGLGAGWNHQCSFLLPRGVFRTFTALVGNDAALGAQSVNTFEILLDDKPVFATGKISGEKAVATAIEIPLGDAAEITLRAKSEGIPSRTHAVWGEPTLRR